MPKMIVLLLLALPKANAYKFFQSMLPNADHIPHPCKPNFIWHGLGHQNAQGGGQRNPFGRDFEKEGKKWTKKLCEMDSDGDKKSNGVELGDPDCKWQPGQIPTNIKTLSHPGVCEPISDPVCKQKNDWDFCKTTEFTCNATRSTDVKELVYRIPPTPVPGSVTTYMCMTFDLPVDADYHLIAYDTIINNTYVMHHMLLYGCSTTTGGSKFITKPGKCGMEVSLGECGEVIGGWTLGEYGLCYEELMGFLVGKNGVKRFIMEMHWNNPEQKTDYIDSSGIKLYITKNLRRHNAGVMTVGPMYLAIPPGMPSYTEKFTCNSDCTKTFLASSIFVTSAGLHMHYLGKNGRLEVYRSGNKIKDLALDVEYRYDNPVTHIHYNPVEVKPGDELKLSCTYKSQYKSKYTYYGDATDDEMCYGFVTYYPAQKNLQYCLNYKSLDLCQAKKKENGGTGTEVWVLGGCDLWQFLYNKGANVIGTKLFLQCGSGKCSAECRKVISEARQNLCLKGDVGGYVETLMKSDKSGQSMVKALHLCDEIYTSTTTATVTSTATGLQDKRTTNTMMIFVLYPFLYLIHMD